jgi:CRP-like cAMP-binding protein
LGEIEFFTDGPRILTAKALEYTECYVIEKKDFMKIVEDYIPAIVISIYHMSYSFLVIVP